MQAGSRFKLIATGGCRPIDAGEIRRALEVLCDPASPIQIQALGPHTGEDEPKLSYTYKQFRPRDYASVVAAASTITSDKRHWGVYLTLNPFPVGLDHACRNTVVTARRWLMIDCDSVRPKDSNATDTEKDAARELALKVMDHLTEAGWPQPVGIDSGNGWHLLYRVELPNDALSRHLCRDVLRALARRFDDPARAVVDQGTFAAKQQTKLPGTLVCKGPHSEERPHRRAGLKVVPEELVPVPGELLQALAAEVRKPTPNASTVPPRQPFLGRAGGGNGSVRAYCQAAMRNEFARLVTCPQHFNNAVNEFAFRMGQLVQPGGLTREEVEQEAMLGAHVVGLMDREEGKTLDTIKRAVADGMKEPRVIPEFDRPSVNGSHAAPPPNEEKAQKSPGPEGKADDGPVLWTLTYNGEVLEENSPEYFAGKATRSSARPGRRVFELRTLEDVLEAELPAPNWCIPGLLAEGLNLLAGSPKQGKSMLALNLAITVAGGGKALGNIQTIAGDVVYLSLEDKLRRVQSRARKMVRVLGRECARRLVVVTDWPRMDQGGLVMLEKWVKRVERPTLFLVDVLVRFRPASRERGNQYEQDAKVMGDIKDFADANSVTGLILHHTRKSKGKDDESADIFEGISGTSGIYSPCDGLIVLKRPRNNNEAVISLTGRDDMEQQLALRFDPENLIWSSLGTAEDHLSGKLQLQVLEYFKLFPDRPIFPADIAGHIQAKTGVEESADKVRVVLHRLAEKGIIRRAGRGWTYPGGMNRRLYK